MIVAGAIFGISFIGIVGVLANKVQHMRKGRAFFRVSENTNAKVQKMSNDAVYIAKNAPRVIVHTAAYIVLRYGIKAFEKTKKKIYPRIAHLVDAVKGRDIPKQRGEASDYLNDIKKHKDTLK